MNNDLRQNQGTANMSLFTMSNAIKYGNQQAAMGPQVNVAPAESRGIRPAYVATVNNGAPIQNTIL